MPGLFYVIRLTIFYTFTDIPGLQEAVGPLEVLGPPGLYLMAPKMAPGVQDPRGRLDHHRARGPRSAEDPHQALEVPQTSGSDSKAVPRVQGHPQGAEAVGVRLTGAEEGAAAGSTAPGAQVVLGLLWGWNLADKGLGSWAKDLGSKDQWEAHHNKALHNKAHHRWGFKDQGNPTQLQRGKRNP